MVGGSVEYCIRGTFRPAPSQEAQATAAASCGGHSFSDGPDLFAIDS